MYKIKSSLHLQSFLVITFCSLGLPVLAEAASQSTTTNGYPAEFAPAVLSKCRQGATAQGLANDVVEKQCSCFVNNLQAQISFDKLTTLSQQAHESGKPSPEIQSIYNSCKK